jgi:hypothetical protein
MAMEQSHLFYVAQAAYFLTLLSYSTWKITWFRTLAIFAGCITVFFNFNAAGTPLWIPILWNVLFVGVNGIHLALAVWRRKDVKLDALESFLAKTVLANFSSGEVRSFSALAAEGSLPSRAPMVRANSELRHLFCILQGKVDVLIQGRKVAELGPGRFVGEMSLLTRSVTRADVQAATDLKLLVWTHESIEKWVDTDPSRLGLLQTALGTQVVEELLRQQVHAVEEVTSKEVA